MEAIFVGLLFSYCTVFLSGGSVCDDWLKRRENNGGF